MRPWSRKKLEDGCGAIVARGVVGRAREPIAFLPICDPLGSLPLGQRGELAEPSGHDRPKVVVGGDPQEAVALAELAVLVPAADDECVVESLVGERNRHDVERVVSVYQQARSMAAAARGHLGEPAGKCGRCRRRPAETSTSAVRSSTARRQPLGQRRRAAPRAPAPRRGPPPPADRAGGGWCGTRRRW